MTFYLDASAVVPLLVVEASSAAVEQFLKSADQLFLVSDFAAGEVTSAIARQFRIGILTRAEAERVLTDFDTLRLTDTQTPSFDALDVRAAALFVRRFDLKLRLPDAIHVATCQRLGVTLVTLDLRLANAATALGIAVRIPG